jgi:hypothetical protein
LNADAGATTQMASIISAALVILAVVFLLPALTHLPKCVLGAMYVIATSIVAVSFTSDIDVRRIGLVVNSILSDTPHDVLYFWRCVRMRFICPRFQFDGVTPTDGFCRMSAWTDLAMMCLTFIFTVAWSVEVGIIVSVAVSLLLIIRRSSETHIKILVSPFCFSGAGFFIDVGSLLSLLLRDVYRELICGNLWMKIQ